MLPWSKDSRIGVIGFGVEGKAITTYLSTQRYDHIAVYDKNKDCVVLPNIQGYVGETYLDNLHHVDVIIRSPGIPFSLVQEKAKQCGTTSGKNHIITSLTELIFDLVPAQIIGITGSNGKTTTTNLIEYMLTLAGKNFLRFGNDSYPDLDAIFSLQDDDLLLLEMSSFQLEPLQKSPHIALLTNITPNHLDYHPSMQEYTEAKMNIARFQGNNDYFITTAAISESFGGKKITIPHSSTAFIEEEHTDAKTSDPTTSVLNLNHWHTSLFLTDLPFKTHINNILMVLEVARILDFDTKIVLKGLKTFSGVPHRLELVGIINGISYYNDSSSTTPESTFAAFGQFPAQTIFLMGGSSKNLSFTELGKEVVTYNVQPVVYGLTAPAIKEAILQADPEYTVLEAKDMYEALETAEHHVLPNGSIVLSPACASFDQFPNAKVRGRLFTETVQQKSNSITS